MTINYTQFTMRLIGKCKGYNYVFNDTNMYDSTKRGK